MSILYDMFKYFSIMPDGQHYCKRIHDFHLVPTHFHRGTDSLVRDVIEVVSQYARNDHEVGLAVADLIHRGVVRLHTRHQRRRPSR